MHAIWEQITLDITHPYIDVDLEGALLHATFSHVEHLKGKSLAQHV